jgi:EAL and modified HD-GYP domain-containing signal transduction protein
MSKEAPPKPADICLARQPIFDRNRQVQGYELLYRGPMTDVTDEVEGRATATVLVNAFMEIGLPHLVGDKPCFINLNNSLLGSDMLSCLPADRVVFEILENTVATPESIARVRELRDRGFRIAIDDYVFQPSLDPFRDYAEAAENCWRKRSRPTRNLIDTPLSAANISRVTISCGRNCWKGS